MEYKLRCCLCGATVWTRGTFPCDETGAVDINEKLPKEWNGGQESCLHEEYDIIDSETDQGDD